MTTALQDPPAEVAGRRRPRAAGVALWVAIGVFGLWAAVRTFGLEAGYPGIAAMAFTPYVAAISVLPLLVAMLLRRWRAVAVAALVVVSLLVAVVPRMLPDVQHGGGGPQLRVLTANLHLGESPAKDVFALVRRLEPDVVVFEELSTDLARDLDHLGMDSRFPHRILPNGISQDSAVYSRHPLRAVTTACDPTVAEPCALITLPSGQSVEVRAAHPASPHDPEHTRMGQRGLDALPPAPRTGPARILAGDFNATLDHAALIRVLDTGYRDAADAVGAGLSPTWQSGRPLPPVTIDHVLVDERAKVLRVSTHPLPRTDHRAVLAELELPAA